MSEATADCLFCRIARGEIPATTVHEDNDIVAFRDINPQAPTHILVIPREHIGSAAEVSVGQHPLWGRMLEITQRLAEVENRTESGYRVVTNVGADGGQTVAHLHLHLLAGRALSWPPG